MKRSSSCECAGKLRCYISQDVAFNFLEWFLFFVFIIVAGWFSFGVLQHFVSQKTDFSQHEEEIKNYPVISLVLFGYKASEVNLTNIMILYCTNGMEPKFNSCNFNLEIGKNHFHNDIYNKTEEVNLESLEDSRGRRVYRIIHITPILEEREMPFATVTIYTKLKKKTKSFSDLVVSYLTSQENSPGIIDRIWKDGKALKIISHKNNFVQYSIQPYMTKYLDQMGKCQIESYYECIVSRLDGIVYEFNDCSIKCIPDVFSITGQNYSKPFCQNDTDSQQCFFEHKQEIASNCKKSCSVLEYFGEFELNIPYPSKKENWNVYCITYILTNQDFTVDVYEQYLIFDAIEMIGSVGGTVGMRIKFSNY